MERPEIFKLPRLRGLSDPLKDAVPTTEPVAAPAQRDPLADAGVVPDLPVEPVVTPETDPLLEEEQSDVTNSPAR